MAEIRVLPAVTDAELERSLEVSNAVFPREREDLAGVREAERQARAFVVFLAEEDGELAGSGLGLLPGYTDTPMAVASVLPGRRGRGVGTALYRELSRWARGLALEELRSTVAEDDPDSLDWARRRGFAEQSRDLLVELDLTRIEAPVVETPEGIEVVAWRDRPDLIRGIYEVAAEAWPDIPGSDDERIEPFDEWLDAHMSGIGDSPDATFVAVAGDEVVGYAKLTLWPAKPETAFHDLTGVKRAWRGRGIARALKAAQVAWAKQNGYARLRTANEQRNEPIRRLNAELGYRPIPGRIRLRGPLAHERTPVSTGNA